MKITLARLVPTFLLAGVSVLSAAPAGDRNLGIHCIFPPDAFYHAGKGGRILDVTRPPFGAKGDGVADDTVPLIRAYSFVAEKIRAVGIHNADASFIIYLPPGTYRTAVVDEAGGVAEEVLLNTLPPRPGTAAPSRPAKYINEFFLPLYVHHEK